MPSSTHGAQANEMSAFFDDPHPERLSPPDSRCYAEATFVGVGMSSTDLNNEDYFSDHPKRLPSF
jgi:hypothetical protein